MNTTRTWVILGASGGLAPSAIRYLHSRNQTVIPIFINGELADYPITSNRPDSKIIQVPPLNHPDFLIAMRHVSDYNGRFDFLINNNFYNLSDSIKSEVRLKKKMGNSERVRNTLGLIQLLLPFMKDGKESHLINLQPKHDLTDIESSEVLNEYCDMLYQKLLQLKIQLHLY